MTTVRRVMWATACLAGLACQGLAAEESSDSGVSIAPPGPIEEVVVLGKFIPDEKRTTSEISNVLDEEALGLLADTSVGDALSRVTGLSLVGGKYVYVRGLGERYSSTLLDGSRISSPVPFQKTVPLDIVPKSMVSNLLVQKTYSAQYPGDFSGGVVDIRTRTTPETNFWISKSRWAETRKPPAAKASLTKAETMMTGVTMMAPVISRSMSVPCPVRRLNP